MTDNPRVQIVLTFFNQIVENEQKHPRGTLIDKKTASKYTLQYRDCMWLVLN